MMQPSDVTNGMVDAYLAPCVYTTGNADPDELRHVKRYIGAAINAMPDDLLRKLVAERGCVMVPKDSELDRLRAENARLREALNKISKLDYTRAATNCAAFDAVQLARAALGGQEHD